MRSGFKGRTLRENYMENIKIYLNLKDNQKKKNLLHKLNHTHIPINSMKEMEF